MLRTALVVATPLLLVIVPLAAADDPQCQNPENPTLCMIQDMLEDPEICVGSYAPPEAGLAELVGVGTLVGSFDGATWAGIVVANGGDTESPLGEPDSFAFTGLVTGVPECPPDGPAGDDDYWLNRACSAFRAIGPLPDPIPGIACPPT